MCRVFEDGKNMFVDLILCDNVLYHMQGDGEPYHLFLPCPVSFSSPLSPADGGCRTWHHLSYETDLPG